MQHVQIFAPAHSDCVAFELKRRAVTQRSALTRVIDVILISPTGGGSVEDS